MPYFIEDNFESDLSDSSIDWSEIVSGGVPKDGIPSIDNPNFEPITATSIPKETEGLLLEIDGQVKFYPYNILVRHEIVNDTLAGQAVAVTFCPLCGSGIVFNRTVNGDVTEFGVSGLLKDSNMIMYDRSTESLWQQALGRSFAGKQSGYQLDFLPVQLMTVAEAQDSNPNAQILTTDTGIPGYSTSSYQGTPYGNYDSDNDYFIFKPSKIDARYPSKEIFQIVKAEDYSVAIRRENITANTTLKHPELDIEIAVDDAGLITAFSSSAEKLPSYFEMWFSWAVQHKDSDKAIVWEP